MFKVVIDDTLYEISCTNEYISYLKEQIKRLNKIEKFEEKTKTAKKESEVEYYREYMKILFQQGENYENYKQVLAEYENALSIKNSLVDSLYKEIDIIKSLKV